MNTWELMQFQKANPDLFPDNGPQWTSEGGLLSLGRSEENPYKDMSAKDILAIGSSAPGRIGEIYSAIAAGSTPTDRTLASKLYDIMQTATTEERAWLASNPQWMLLNGQLEGAGLIESTDTDPIGKYWGPLYRTIVTAIIGAGAVGAAGAATGATSGTGLFGLGNELGLTGAWGGDAALTGTEAATGTTLAGGTTGTTADALGTTMGSTLSDLGYSGLFDSSLASISADTLAAGGTGVMESLSALGELGIPESIAAGTASSSAVIDWLKENPSVVKALASGTGELVKYFGSQAAFDDVAALAKDLQESATYSPYNVTGPAGSATFTDGTANIALSDEQKSLYDQYTGLANQYYSDVSSFDTNAYVSKYLDWMRETSKDYETRGFEQLSSKLLNTGMLGGEAGSRALGEYYKNLYNTDLNRQMTAETAGLNRLNSMFNLYNTSAANTQSLLAQPYNYAQLGAAMGSGQSAANAAAASYPWQSGTWNAAGTSGMWSELGNSIGNALGSMFSNNGTSSSSSNNYGYSNNNSNKLWSLYY